MQWHGKDDGNYRMSPGEPERKFDTLFGYGACAVLFLRSGSQALLLHA